MRILITGHEGFIGRNFWRFFQRYYPNYLLKGIDLKDNEDCKDFFRNSNEKFDLILHCAAMGPNRIVQEKDLLIIAENFSIDSEMFQWAVRTNQKRIVYFSSMAAYPANLQEMLDLLEEDLIDLDDIRNPENVYGWVKLMGELQAREARKKELKVHVVRLAGGYGENQDLDYPFPSLIKRIKDKQDPFEVWGSGKQSRDFVHVDDIIGCIMRMIELDIQGPINIGSGIGLTFNKLAERMFEVSGWRLSQGIKNLTDKPEGVFCRVPDISRMKEFYLPKISIEEGIKRCLNL